MISLIIEGKPQAQKRARVSRNRFYDPQSKDKIKVQLQLVDQLKLIPKFKPFECPMAIEMAFVMPIPKSLSKKKQREWVMQPHIFSPDVDNLWKFSTDCMNKIVYLDDKLIYNMSAVKLYGIHPCTKIHIYPLL